MNLVNHLAEMTGKSLGELADEFKINRLTFYAYARGSRKLPLKFLQAVHEKYGLSWDKLGEFIKAEVSKSK